MSEFVHSAMPFLMFAIMLSAAFILPMLVYALFISLRALRRIERDNP